MIRLLGLAREVVAKRTAIVAAAAIILNLAVGWGWITSDQSAQAVSVIGSIIIAVGALINVAVTRSKVTPTADPRADDGEPLMRVDEHIAALHDATAHVPEHAVDEAALAADSEWPHGKPVDEVAADEGPRA